MEPNTDRLAGNKSAAIVIALGVVYSLWAASFTGDEVFFSLDGAIKALTAKQFASGNVSFDLQLAADDWVANLWSEGLYPFREPFVYRIDGKYFTSFDFLFPLISAPFYRAFGYRGLQILPLVCLWLTWLVFWKFAQREKLGGRWTAAGLFILIFCSNLTLFGAMFWEHTVSAFPVFLSLFLFSSKNRPALFMSGALLGLSIWFRSEIYLLLFFFGLIVFAINPLRMSLKDRLTFTVGAALSVAGLWCADFFVYGHPLGTHAFQMLDLTASARIRKFAAISLPQNRLLLLYFPACAFYMVLAGYRIAKKRDGVFSANGLVLLAASLFIIFSPAILPNWSGRSFGPRYLLAIVPPVALYFTVELKRLFEKDNRGRLAATTILAFCLALGFFANTIRATRTLKLELATRVKPAQDYIEKSPIEVVVIPNDRYGGFEFEKIMPKKIAFLTSSDRDVNLLVDSLLQNGHDKFLCVFYDYTGEKNPLFEKSGFRQKARNATLTFNNKGKHGNFYIFEIDLKK